MAPDVQAQRNLITAPVKRRAVHLIESAERVLEELPSLFRSISQSDFLLVNSTHQPFEFGSVEFSSTQRSYLSPSRSQAQ